MQRYHRVRGDRRMLAVATVLCLAGAGMVSGCSGWKQAIGLDPMAPNEFEVESRAPLTIPPDFALRPPQPGKSRPQETASDIRAREALERAGPGQPAKPGAGKAEAGGGPAAIAGSGERQVDPNSQVLAGSFASKLLDYDGAGGADVRIDSRETSPLKGVH